MKVILCENVPNLGEMGDTVNVTSGYARNFLLPRKLAVPKDSATAKQIEHETWVIGRREEKKRTELKKVAETISKLTVEIKAKAGEEDKLFGSVTAANIADNLKQQGHDVDRKHIVIEEPIKTIGIHTVTLKLGNGVDAKIKVWVSKEEEEKVETA